jgi:hypothetical protein
MLMSFQPTLMVSWLRYLSIGGKRCPVATAHLCEDISLARLMEIWNEFVHWRTTILPTLPEAERLFHTTMNNKPVWVIEDDAAVTLMYPEDY